MRRDAIRPDDSGRPARGNRRYSISESQMQFGKATGRKMLRIQDGKITQEIGLDDGVKALTQLGLIKAA
jgi:hypothetical protein